MRKELKLHVYSSTGRCLHTERFYPDATTEDIVSRMNTLSKSGYLVGDTYYPEGSVSRVVKEEVYES